MDIQALIDGTNQRESRKRAETQMTLGQLISRLQDMPLDAVVANLQDPHSYRGYYTDLAFKLTNGVRRPISLLADCQAAMGKVFTGYKGGEFVMGENTPLWIADYGCCGVKLLDVLPGGELATRDDD